MTEGIVLVLIKENLMMMMRANPNSWETQEEMGHWTPTGVEPMVYDDDDDERRY